LGLGEQAGALELLLWCWRALGRWLVVWVTLALVCGINPLSLSRVCRTVKRKEIVCAESAEGCGAGGENPVPSQRLIISTVSCRPGGD
jgi:hypothetical protein